MYEYLRDIFVAEDVPMVKEEMAECVWYWPEDRVSKAALIVVSMVDSEFSVGFLPAELSTLINKLSETLLYDDFVEVIKSYTYKDYDSEFLTKAYQKFLEILGEMEDAGN